MGKKINLNEYRARTAAEAQFEVELGDGPPFVVPPLAMWPDEVAPFAMAGKIVEAAEMVLGKSEFARFRAAGGTATLLFAALQDELGVDLGKSSR